jgi:outer membrane protein assembly factor BamB
VSCLGLASGKRLWEFAAPDYPLITKPSFNDTQLSAFRLTAARLFLLQGERRLFALDAASGQVLWSHWAPAGPTRGGTGGLTPRRSPAPGGRFNPLYHADPEHVVVQTGGGKRLVLDSRTGRLLRESTRGENIWLEPPLALAEGRLCLIPDSGHVVLFDPRTGKNVWTHSTRRARDSTTSTGEPARVVGNRETLLVLVPLNIGYQVERLDPNTGDRLWEDGYRIVHDALESGQVGFGRDAVYYANRKLLQARSLATGKLLWSRALPGPGGPWRAVCSTGSVLAFPAQTREGRGQYNEDLPVLCCDAGDGELIQRLNFAGENAALAVQLGRHCLVVGSGRRAWVLHDSAQAE